MLQEQKQGGSMAGFGPYLAKALRERGISASEAARGLGYKSRNSIFRVLDESGGYAALVSCYEKIESSGALGLTPEELAHLKAELEVSRVGLSGYISNQAMRAMLQVDEQRLKPILWRGGGELFDSIAASRKIELTILGTCSRGLMQAIAFAIFRAEGAQARVTHYLYTGGEEIIENISAIQPLIYARCYTVYGIEPGTLTPELERCCRCGRILARLTDEQGRTKVLGATPVSADRILVSELSDAKGHTELEKILEEYLPRMHPLKSVFPVTNTPQDYLRFTREYSDIERGRAIYTIKLDVPINFIHPDVLLSSVVDGFEETGFAQGEGLEELIAAFRQIQQERWENFFTKRRPTHTIFSLPAMERFARTGRQSDHFYAMRAYTPQERVAILRHIREQTEKNPNFSVYFFKDDYQPPKTEIGLYEGVGTLMSKPYTNYDLAGDHAEALITQPEFCRKYKEFFTQDLLVNHVRSGQETLKALDRLIQIAQEH